MGHLADITRPLVEMTQCNFPPFRPPVSLICWGKLYCGCDQVSQQQDAMEFLGGSVLQEG